MMLRFVPVVLLGRTSSSSPSRRYCFEMGVIISLLLIIMMSGTSYIMVDVIHQVQAFVPPHPFSSSPQRRWHVTGNNIFYRYCTTNIPGRRTTDSSSSSNNSDGNVSAGSFTKIWMTSSNTNMNNEKSNTTTTTTIIPSSPFDRPVLSAIDAISLTLFAGIGASSHSVSNSAVDIFIIALPFLVSWFLVSPLLGTFTPDATRDISAATVQTAKGWSVAIPLGCILRGISKGYLPPVPFVIVTLLSTLVLLTVGRILYTVLAELYVEMF